MPFRRLSAIACAAMLASAVSAQDIGVVASVAPNLTGQNSGQGETRLSLGTSVFLNQTIRADAAGRGQLLFRDETTLSIAPRSQVLLDTFVYDPGRRTGQVGLSLTEGVLRFIGGRGSRSSEATIRTPGATIGIRGSSAIVRHVGGRTMAIFLMGQRMCLTTGGGERTCTSRRGSVLSERGYEGKISPASLQEILESIDGAPPSALARRNLSGGAVAGSVAPGDAPVPTDGRGGNLSVLDRERAASGELGLFSDGLGSGDPTGGTLAPHDFQRPRPGDDPNDRYDDC